MHQDNNKQIPVIRMPRPAGNRVTVLCPYCGGYHSHSIAPSIDGQNGLTAREADCFRGQYTVEFTRPD